MKTKTNLKSGGCIPVTGEQRCVWRMGATTVIPCERLGKIPKDSNCRYSQTTAAAIERGKPLSGVTKKGLKYTYLA